MKSTLLSVVLVCAGVAGGCSSKSASPTAADARHFADSSDKPPYPPFVLCFDVVGPQPYRQCKSHPLSNPVDAYKLALQKVNDVCGTDYNCRGTSTIALYAIFDVDVHDATLWERLFKAYGMRAMFNDAVSRNRMLLNAARSSMRAPDLKQSLGYVTEKLIQGAWFEQLIAPYSSRYQNAQHDLNVKEVGALNAKVDATLGPEMTKLAAQTFLLANYKAHLDSYVQRLDALRPAFDVLANRFFQYRSSELTDFAFLNDLSARASAADLQALVLLQKELVDHSRDMSSAPEQLRADVADMRRAIFGMQEDLDRYHEQYKTELAAAGFQPPDKTSAAVASLAKMEGYIGDRARRVQAAIDQQLDGIIKRKHALLIVAADDLTKKALVDAANAQEETAFLDEANKRVATLWAAPDRSLKLQLPYQEELAGNLKSFLGTDAICADGFAWMKSGCDVYRRNVSKANTYLAQSMPLAIRVDVRKLRSAGIADPILAEIDAALTAKDVMKAAHLHDIAVRMSE